MRLEGKVAIVAGASAERGTGWAIAERFAAEGARVVLAARRQEEAAALAARIGGTALRCDMCNEQDVAALVDAVLREHGRLDVAVNAAGGAREGRIADASDEMLRDMLQLNYFAHVYFVRHAARVMTDGGSVILFSSFAATHPIEHLAPYACAKAATDCLVRYAALEYGARGIRVNSILPGTIASDQAQLMLGVPGMEALCTREVPLGRVGQPADFADAALWLAADAFVTGLNLPVSGGNQLQRFPRAAERERLAGDARTI